MEDESPAREKRSQYKWAKRGLIVMLSLGAAAVVYSIYQASTTLAFIGLSLTFWGALFIFILPGKYVEREVLDSMVSSSLSALNKLIEDSKCSGKGVYLPPYPKDVYLPLSHLKGLEDGLVYVPKQGGKSQFQIEEAFTKNPKGMSITPPGLSLAKLIEKKMSANLFDSNIDFLTDALPSILVDDIGLAREVKIDSGKDFAHVEMSELACEELCKEVSKLTNICFNIGCPLTSSIACLLTKVSGKPVVIEKCRPENGAIEIQYHILEG